MLLFFNKIETPKAYHNSTLDVRCSMLDVHFLDQFSGVFVLKKINPVKTTNWKKLADHYEMMKSIHMKNLFADDPERFKTFSITFNDILVDYSKNRISGKTLRLLIGLAHEVGLKDAIDKMFSGAGINETENRAVLHVALRNRKNSPIYVNNEIFIGKGKGVMVADSYAAASSMLDAFSMLNQPVIIQEYIETEGVDIRAIVCLMK